KNFKIENGLSSNSVWTVMQDSKGFMWFGTKDGLNRFDGRNFKVYRNSLNDSLSIGHNFIHCIKEDSRKRMLIGTRQGLYLYNREKDNFKHVPLAPAQEKEVNINDIMEDLQGNIWVACHGQGLYKLTSELIVEKHYLFKGEQENVQSNFIWTIVTDHYGNLWIGTAGIGLIHFDIKNERFTPIVKRRNLETDNQSIYSIHCDNDNNLWIGTSTNGLFKYNHISGKATHYLKNTGSVKSIKEYSDEELIMGSDKGLIIFNKKTEKYRVMEDNSTDNSIFSITRDNEGSFWVGTYFGGVNYFSPMTNKFSYYTDLQENNSTGHIVSSIVEDIDGTILISTHNNNNIY
ncbi:MAG: two-component regulator propeller domain-containing protein, partial [Lachnospiraceae bacterium]|nr:two-component regulator propeller domain-containing protein [Lachnospiraceae bacterium]